MPENELEAAARSQAEAIRFALDPSKCDPDVVVYKLTQAIEATMTAEREIVASAGEAIITLLDVMPEEFVTRPYDASAPGDAFRTLVVGVAGMAAAIDHSRGELRAAEQHVKILREQADDPETDCSPNEHPAYRRGEDKGFTIGMDRAARVVGVCYMGVPPMDNREMLPLGAAREMFAKRILAEKP